VFDAFIKIDGVDGESSDTKHAKEIQILDFEFGSKANLDAGTGNPAGRTKMSDLRFCHHVDKASTALFNYHFTHKRIPKVVLSVRRAGGQFAQDFMVITLTDAIIAALTVNGSTGKLEDMDNLDKRLPLPIETVTLNFAGFSIDYREQSADGGTKSSSSAEYKWGAR